MSVDPTTVSVIICAYALDRWVDICDAVKSVMLQRPPVGEIIIVVDHNPELLSRLRAQFPGHRVVANREAPGLSGARNTGVCAARGCLLAFLDDDAVAAPDWVAGMLRHFVKPSVLGVTTRVMPIWQGPRPPWFPDEFLWVLGCTHAGLRSGPVRNLMGGSMCLSRDGMLVPSGPSWWWAKSRRIPTEGVIRMALTSRLHGRRLGYTCMDFK